MQKRKPLQASEKPLSSIHDSLTAQNAWGNLTDVYIRMYRIRSLHKESGWGRGDGGSGGLHAHAELALGSGTTEIAAVAQTWSKHAYRVIHIEIQQ